MMNGKRLDDKDLVRLKDVARQAPEPTLFVGTDVLEQMIDEIVELRRNTAVMQAILTTVESCGTCDVCADRAAATLLAVSKGEATG